MSEIAIHTETHGGERKSRLAHAFERPALGLKRAVILYRDAKIRLLKAKNSNRFNNISFFDNFCVDEYQIVVYVQHHDI